MFWCLSMRVAIGNSSNTISTTGTVPETSATLACAAVGSTSDSTGEVIRTGTAEIQKALGLIDKGSAINYEGAGGPMDFSGSCVTPEAATAAGTVWISAGVGAFFSHHSR